MTKNNYRSIASLILILFFCHSCQQKSNSRQEAENYIQIHRGSEKQSIDTEKIFSQVKFLKLESREDLLIADIFKIIIRNEKVFLFDFQQAVIFAFDLKGHFLFKIDKPDNGIDEKFKYLVDFEVSPFDGKIVLVDYNAFKLYFYDDAGQYLGERKNNYYAQNIFPVSRDKWVIKNGESDSPKTPNVIYYTDSAFNLSGKTLLKEVLPINSVISTSKPFFNYQNSIRFVHGLGNQIYSLEDEELKVFMDIDFGENEIPTKLLTSNKPREVIPAFQTGINAGMLAKYLETDDFILFDYYRGGNDAERGRRTTLFSKEAKRPVFSARGLKNSHGNFNVKWPVEVYDNYFVSSMNFYDFFENNYKVIQDQNRMSVSPQFGWMENWQSVISSSMAYDSPILVFTKFASQ